jgi:DNA-binding NarL/FixJ family response regulator
MSTTARIVEFARSASPAPMRTLIVEDQGMFRDLLAKVCTLLFHFTDVQTADSGAAAEAALRKASFDLLILDIDLPDRDGFTVADFAASLAEPPRVLGMSAYCDAVMVHRIMHSNMHGFVDKSGQSIDTLQEAIRAVVEGHFFFTGAVRQMQLALRNDPLAFPKLLTDRECEMLTLLGKGLSAEDAGARLGVAPATANWHRKQIMRKLGLRSAVDLVLYAVEKGFTRLGTTRPPPA